MKHIEHTKYQGDDFEICPYCGEKVWSAALHIFSCEVLNEKLNEKSNQTQN